MQIRLGYELVYECPQPTPMILMLHVHHSRVSDLATPDHVIVSPATATTGYRDSFGNWCTRLLAPAGTVRLTSDTVIRDSGALDPVVPLAEQHSIQSLPDDTLQFLLPSRYCESDLLAETAWQLFSATPPGWARVQAITELVHRHITFGYDHASPTKTALQVFHSRQGVCRDFAHLAIAFCRCMNIPARYCTGYLGDIGVSVAGPMDFSGWMEVYLGGQWHTFDPRNLVSRAGRVLIARGRDAADVAISTSFGPNTLRSFRVWSDELAE